MRQAKLDGLQVLHVLGLAPNRPRRSQKMCTRAGSIVRKFIVRMCVVHIGRKIFTGESSSKIFTGASSSTLEARFSPSREAQLEVAQSATCSASTSGGAAGLNCFLHRRRRVMFAAAARSRTHRTTAPEAPQSSNGYGCLEVCLRVGPQGSLTGTLLGVLGVWFPEWATWEARATWVREMCIQQRSGQSKGLT